MEGELLTPAQYRVGDVILGRVVRLAVGFLIEIQAAYLQGLL